MAAMPKHQQDRIAAAKDRAREIAKVNLERLNGAGRTPETPAPEPEPPEPAEAPVPPEVPPEPVEEPSEPSTPPLAAAEDVETWKQRWRSADGMLKQQGEQWRRDKEALAQRAEQAESRADELEQRLQALELEAAQNKPVTAEDLRKYFTADQIERLGEDECRELLTVQRRLAADEAQVTRATMQKMLKEVNASTEQDKARLQRLGEDQFFAAMDTMLPNWREVDADPDFHVWLNQLDDLSGRTRRELGIEAKAALDAKRFAAIYRNFQLSRAKPAGAAPKRRLPTGSVPADAPTTPADKPVVSKQEIEEYRMKVARGYYRTRPEEMQRARARILSAHAEHRLR